MKNFAIAAFAALVATASLSSVAKAEYCNDDYSSYHRASYRHHDYDSSYCHYKNVKWYDDYGYIHYKQVKICD
jgi:hypothetical protein